MDLTTTDASGNQATVTDLVVVRSTVALAVAFTTGNQCTERPTRFATPRQDITAWQWDFGDPTSPDNTSSLQNPVHRYAREGTYAITLTVSGDNGCNNRLTRSVTIYGNQKPQPAFAAPAQFCSFADVPFADQSIAALGDSVRA